MKDRSSRERDQANMARRRQDRMVETGGEGIKLTWHIGDTSKGKDQFFPGANSGSLDLTRGLREWRKEKQRHCASKMCQFGWALCIENVTNW